MVAVALALLLSGAITTEAAAQSPANAPAPPLAQAAALAASTEVPPNGQPVASEPSAPLPVDLEHIRKEAGKQPAVKLDDQRLRFYVLILAKQPNFSFSETVGEYDLMNGPTKGGAAMTHKEFLSMVTPKELNELFGATSGSSFAMLQAAIMNAAGQALIKKAVQQLRHARSEGEVQEIRQRIDTELNSLYGRDQ